MHALMRNYDLNWDADIPDETIEVDHLWERLNKERSLTINGESNESIDELRFKLKFQTEYAQTLKGALHRLRVGYFKELDVLRAAVQSSRAEIEYMTAGVSPSAELEAFIADSGNMYFYDLKEGLVEPELLEVFRKALKHSNRLLLEQIHALHQLMIKAGLEVPGGVTRRAPESPRRLPVAPKVKPTLTAVSDFYELDAYVRATANQSIEAKPLVRDNGQDPPDLAHAETAPQTVGRPQRTLHCFVALSLEPFVEPPPPVHILCIQCSDHLSIASVAHEDIRLDTTDLVPPPPKRIFLEATAQTRILNHHDQQTSTKVVHHTTESAQTEPEEEVIRPGRKPLGQLTDQDNELLDEYIQTFRESILNSLKSDPVELLKHLSADAGADLTATSDTHTPDFTDDEHGTHRSSVSPSSSSMLITQRALIISSGRDHNDADRLRRQIMQLRAEIGDLQGRLSIQSRRLTRALHSLGDVKREKDESSGRAEECMEKVNRVRDTLRKLRRELRSRDRKIHYLSRNLVREIRRRNHSCPPPQVAMEIKRYEQGDILEDADSEAFMMSSRSVTKVRSFSFEPITSVRIHDVLHASHNC